MFLDITTPTLIWAGALLLMVVFAALLRAFLKIQAINSKMVASEQSRAQNMLADSMTGLLNRLGLTTAISSRQKTADQEESSFSVICLKIDDWTIQTYAASFGPDAEILRELADRLAQACPKGHQIGTLGAGEFFILCSGNTSVALDLCRKLMSSLLPPFKGPHGDQVLTASICIACYPEHGQLSQLLLNSSVAANRAAKEELRVALVYSSNLSRDLREQTLLLTDLRMAIELQQFEIYLQPKVDAGSLKITAVEALVRWRHPIRGVMSPSIFIPIAERNGLIGEIGDWVITEACAMAGTLHKMGLRMRVAVNISGHQLRQIDLAERLDHELKKNHVSPDRFTCEITETVAMEDSQAAKTTFEALRTMGLHVSIDDFGTGHSSLSKLRTLPASELKVDRAFVSDLVVSEDARTVTQSIISMAKALNLRVVAEGVETLQQCEILKKMGCDELQGYLFSMPIPAADMLKLVMSPPTARGTPDFSNTLYDVTVPMELS